jgi:Family of unknown function (DUF6298)/Protein of unknown function (DUF4038)
MKFDELCKTILRKDYMKELLIGLIFCIYVITGCGAATNNVKSVQSTGTGQISVPAADSGLLRVSTINPRYFTDDSGKAIYLTGSHTWSGLIDRGPTDPPAQFDFQRYLDLLQNSNHNFIRLWSRHVTRYQTYGKDVLYGAPLPWARSGPGTAVDGKPRFDLNQFNEAYFSRLRERVIAARERGIYVSLMLFGGYVEISEWAGNPFNSQNNINGIDGDLNGDGKGDTQLLPLLVGTATGDAGFMAARAAMGQTRRYADKMDLINMTPRRDLASTHYALARPGSEYLVYQPQPQPLPLISFRALTLTNGLMGCPALLF